MCCYVEIQSLWRPYGNRCLNMECRSSDCFDMTIRLLQPYVKSRYNRDSDRERYLTLRDLFGVTREVLGRRR